MIEKEFDVKHTIAILCFKEAAMKKKSKALLVQSILILLPEIFLE